VIAHDGKVVHEATARLLPASEHTEGGAADVDGTSH
jgi:hypothetical protein